MRKRTRWWRTSIWGLALALPATYAGANQITQYKVEVQICYIKWDPAKTMNVRSTEMKADSLDIAKPIFYVEEGGELEVAGVVLRIQDGNIIWSAPSPRDGADATNAGPQPSEGPLPDRVSMIASPSLITPVGKESTIEILEPIQSFARREDGTFELINQGNAGLTLACTVTPQRDPQRVKVDWRSSNRRVTGREEIPGVALPIGRPIVTVDTVEQTMDVKLGGWSGAIHLVPDLGVVVDLVRISAWTGEGK